ncbi:MAG: flagellar basal-body rod protein FlgF [Armatimonadetes bacterium]|nr:flagellar basal-body rod protein FlgF [Armatimonadota bacterium]
MLDGMKMAAQGMKAMMEKQDVVANNLANVNTAGFRKDTLLISSFTDLVNQQLGMGDIMQTGGVNDLNSGLQTSTVTYFGQGKLKETGNNFDLALDDNGKGFFTLQTKEGIAFTRNGSFRLNNQGYLIAQDGSYVLGKKGKPIQFKGTNFLLTNDGKIKIDGKEIDQILITTFSQQDNLKKTGESNFLASSGAKVSADYTLRQGYLEMANVNVLKEMVDMIAIMRSYEANQKLMQSQDEVLGKAVNETGRVR